MRLRLHAALATLALFALCSPVRAQNSTDVQLKTAVGDLGIQSGPLATSRSQLDRLKRNSNQGYFAFTLTQGDDPVSVSSVTLQLVRVDLTNRKFDLQISADGRSIGKLKRTANEPLQFYVGSDHQLCEIVVYAVKADSVSGYFSIRDPVAQSLAAGPAKQAFKGNQASVLASDLVNVFRRLRATAQ